MIPKIIHYVWFGHGKKPELIQRCMASWRKYLPEYEIKEWNEDNFDINAVQYVKEAFKERRWAFMSDYVRLYALYTDGGIYMDTDVEVLRPIDRFLSLPAFSGYQTVDECLTGIMGSEKGGQWVKDLMDDYIGRSFYNPDGSINETTNVDYTTFLMRKKGMKIDGQEESIPGYVTFFPVDYFCPVSCNSSEVILTENSYTIHHFCGSWLGGRRRFARKIGKLFGDRVAYYFSYATMRPDKMLKRAKVSFKRKWCKLRGIEFREDNSNSIQRHKIW